MLVFIVSIFGILEYKWFNKIAENEYYKTYNSIILNVNRITEREFERITMFTSWLDKFKYINDSNIDNIEKFITTLYVKYFSDSDSQNVIKSIGYIIVENDQSLEYLYNGNSWQKMIASEETLTSLSNSKDDVKSYFNNENLVMSIFINENTYFLITFDLKEFTNSILIPAITEANSEIEIQWVKQSIDNNLKDNYLSTLSKNLSYKFNPISSLINGPYISNQTLVIPIIKQQQFKKNYTATPFRNKKENFELFIEPPMIDNNLDKLSSESIFAYLGIKIDGNQFYGTYVEKTLSYIFLGGIVLLSLIGIICLLLIYQILRIQKQRNKEREFTASITHELRTPLTVIQSASDNLSENLVRPEKIPAYGKLIKQQSTRLNAMIENLLIYSKIEGNKYYSKINNKVNLKEFFTLQKLQTGALSIEKGIPINWILRNLDENVIIDRNLLELVISNLISNSIFHAYNGIEKGEIRININFSKQNNTLYFTIEDDGIGIPIKEQKYIFNSYFRGEKSKDSQERGSGLGLFIVKKNIAILSGKISLQSPYKRLDGKIKSGCHFELTISCKADKL